MATVLHMSMKQYAEYHRKLGKRLIPAAKRGAFRAALRSQRHLVAATSEAPPANPQQVGIGGAVNYGNFKRSWRSGKTNEGARVYNIAAYAGVIEFGRRIGKFPPIHFIAQWAQRRLSMSPVEAKRAAFPIARAIASRGLLPRRILADAFQDIAVYALEEIKKELDRELRRKP